MPKRATWRSLNLAVMLFQLAVFASGPVHARDSSLLVFAAASLTEVAEAVAAAYGRKAGIDVRVSAAASSTLSQQIAKGAPAGVILSADERWIDWLADRDRLSRKNVVRFAGNELVVVVATGTVVSGFTAHDLLTSLAGGRIAVGDPDHVPVGRYARQVLEDVGVYQDLAPALVPTADTRAALRLVESGQVAAGIVYRTDALAGAVEIAAELPQPDPPVHYFAGRLAGENGNAAGFLQFLTGSESRELLCARGFKPALGTTC